MLTKSRMARERLSRRGGSSVEPYASIRADMLASQAFRQLSEPAVRILLLMEAAYHPGKRWFMPYRHMEKTLGIAPNTVRRALEELIGKGFLVVKRPGRRPRTMGSVVGEGRAAEYDLPHRHESCSVPKWKQHNDPRQQGKWRINCGRLRQKLGRLTGPAARFWAELHNRHHTSEGIPADDGPFAGTSLGINMGMPRSTVRQVLRQLLAEEIIRIAVPGAGRRATTYLLGWAETKPPRPRRRSRSE